MLGFAAGACGTTQIVAPTTTAPIRLGAIYNLTGTQATTDGPALDGARLAVDRINAGGGLLGRRVELLERDGISDPGLVAAAARSLVEADVCAIIGLSNAELVLAAAPVAAAGGVPFVTSGASSPSLPAKVPRWLFLACYGDNAQAAAGAEYARGRLGARTAAIFFDDDREATRRLAGYWAQSFRSLDGVVQRRAHFHTGDRDVAGLLGGASSGSTSGQSDDGDNDEGGESAGGGPPRSRLAPDIVYLAAAAADAGPLVRKLRAAGYHGVIMGGDGFDNATLRRAAAATAGPVYYTTHASLGLVRAAQAVRRFTDWYASAYGRAPENVSACLGFDAVDLVAAALVAAGSAEPAAVRSALQATRGFPGVTGSLSFGGGTRVPRKEVTVVRGGSRPELAAQILPRRVPKP
jgi:branched-chain amino acid transport system substrate-binding protein